MKQELADSAAAYSVSGAAIVVASLADVASTAQALAIIMACIAAGFRLLYDALKFWRFWRNRG